jgi:hypothetical protein
MIRPSPPTGEGAVPFFSTGGLSEAKPNLPPETAAARENGGVAPTFLIFREKVVAMASGEAVGSYLLAR